MSPAVAVVFAVVMAAFCAALGDEVERVPRIGVFFIVLAATGFGATLGAAVAA